MSRIVWVLLITAVIIIPIFAGLHFVNKRDTSMSLSSQSTSLSSSYTKYKIPVRDRLDLSEKPSITIGSNVSARFNFKKVVHVADQDGNPLGDVGPGKSLELGNMPNLKGMYFWSEDGPWEDEIFLCSSNCSN